jgi:hypothetical protein
MNNPEKLQHWVLKTQDEDKKTPPRYVLDTAIRKQAKLK